MKFFKRIQSDSQAKPYKKGHMIYYSDETKTVKYLDLFYLILQFSTNGDGQIMVNEGYINSDGFIDDENYKYNRLDSSNDRILSGKTFYAYDSENTYYITENLNLYPKDTTLSCTVYYDEDGDCDASFEAFITVTKSDKTYDGPLQQTVKYSSGENQSIKIYDDIITLKAYNNNTLLSVVLPNGLSSLGNNTFYGCTNITSIILPNTLETIMLNTFNGCTSLSSITIPDSVTNIGEYAFKNCSSLTSIEIPNKTLIINKYAFEGCTNLSAVTMTNSIENIDTRAFSQCTSLSSITIPNSVTNIGGYAFYNCTNLTSISIPNSITKLSQGTFANCSNLQTINYQGTVTEWASIQKEKNWHENVPSTTVVTCTDGTVQLDE